MKKLFVMVGIALSILIIYITTVDRKVYYLALGDNITVTDIENSNSFSDSIKKYLDYYDKLETYINGFAKNGHRITDIITDINNNKKISMNNKNKTIKNALIKADLLTISVGLNDITSKINVENIKDVNNYQFLYNNVDEITNDLEKLLVLLRQYCKEDIFLIGIYYPYQAQNQELNNVFKYLNARFKEMSSIYKVQYIDIYDIFGENPSYVSSSNIYPSKEGLEAIASQIIVTINNTILKNS